MKTMTARNTKRAFDKTGRIPSARTRRFSFLSLVTRLGDTSRQKGEPLTVMLLEASRACFDVHRPSQWAEDLASKFERHVRTLLRPQDLVAGVYRDRVAVALPGYRECDAASFGDRCRRSLQVASSRGYGLGCRVHVAAGIAELNADKSNVEGPRLKVNGCRSPLAPGKRALHFEPDDGNRIGFCLLQQSYAALHIARKIHPDGTAIWSRAVGARDASSSRSFERGERAEQGSSVGGERSRHFSEPTHALVAAVEAKDPYTKSHSQAVADLSESIGKRLGLNDTSLHTLRCAALLHDIGKIGVPDAILSKPGPLTDREFAIVKRHPQTAMDMLRYVDGLRDVRPLILHHHERYDGAGYPSGLEGEEIPLGARILCVADAVDTMLSPRSYKPPFEVGQARAELLRGSGRQFDPQVVNATIRLLDDGMGRVDAPDPCAVSSG